MRMPNVSKHMNSKKRESNTIRRLEYIPDCDMKIYDLGNEDSRKKFITYIEKSIIRPSYEYKSLIKLLKEKKGLNRDGFFHDVDYNIEIHHTPFTLYDLVEIAITKFCECGMEIDPFYIAEYVMMQHFIGQVGLYPVTKTVHELVHNGQVIIPIQNVYASNLAEYIVENRRHMSEPQNNALEKIQQCSDAVAKTVPDIFSINYISFDSKGKWKLVE